METCRSRGCVHAAQRGSKAKLVRSAWRVVFAGLVTFYFSGAALSKDASDGDDEPAKAASTPNLYLDLRTYYTTVPAGSLSLGFGNSALFATLPTLATLSTLMTLPTLPTGKPEHRRRCSAHGRFQRSRLGLWRI